MFNYAHVKSRSMGHALFVWNKEAQMWQQISKWYWYEGNYKRFVKEASEPCYYKIID